MFNCFIAARDFKVKGKIFDRSSGKVISYAIIRNSDCNCATTANSEGSFEIVLNPSNNILICSSIGYNSDTVFINTISKKDSTNIFLTSAPAFHKILSDSTKTYSAAGLISKVLAAVKTMYSSMNNYEFISRNRYITRENNGVGIGSGLVKVNDDIFKESINLISNIWKTKPMRINGIIEYSSKGYFYSPSSYSEIIEGQKSHSSLPSSLNYLLGTRRVQNLCGEELRFYNRPLPGPLSSGALNYYKYSVEDTLLMDNQKIYKIYFEPIDKNDPGLTGHLYISDSSNNVVKIEASLNLGANVGNLFESISLIQQFIPYAKGIFLPVDYRVFANSNYLGIVKINYEFNSLLSNYKINSNANENNNVKSVQSVMESGRIDSTYWANQETVPLTQEEALAYEKIDSSRTYPTGYIYNISRIVSPQYQLSNHFSISGPLSIYQFNHVEGHTLSFTGTGKNLIDNSIDARFTLSNGFSDKRFKESVFASYYPADDRSVKFSLNAFNNLATLFSSSNIYSSYTSTIYSLLSNRDIRNFYYTKGFDFRVDNEVASFMRINATYSNHTDNSAKTNTTFSLLGNSHRNFSNSNSVFPDSVNMPIYEARLNTLSFGVNFDFRDDVEENYLRRKVSNGHTFVSFGAGILISSPKYLGSDIGYISYNGNILAEINTINTSSLSINITGIYSNGPVPIQMQYALPGNISGTSRDLTFRTVGVGNMFGDQTLALNLEYNFRKEIYRLLPISFLQNLSMNTFFNAAWKNVSDKSAAIMPVAFSVLTRPLLETGFSFGYSSLPISLEFAWRLTHIDKSGFRVGFNTSIL